MLLQDQYETLAALFKSLPSSLPIRQSGSKLPPVIDLELAVEEGVWLAFNKAMHTAFGHKSQGLSIEECRAGLDGTLSVIRWCLKGLKKTHDEDSVVLVETWITALIDAARTKVQYLPSQCPRREITANCEQQLHQAVTDANTEARIKQAGNSRKKTKGWVYVDEDDNEVNIEEAPQGHNSKATVILPPSSDEEYVAVSSSGMDSCESDSDSEMFGISNVEHMAAAEANKVIEQEQPLKKQK
ncbi:hypothetical protein Clacol_000036 [Clathrus columnatus]|uniref:Uncharacterized protein n=1 Tax=Clathrus columnatus TaxID=1419009 RepID=A0AAV4ZW62_9AGAM|nr:hypothetical protein Clacol_000036 [Clathrus columnatus]